jgi:S-methylmethionine-dependent homocysteine/selenocysteine methylase
MASIILLDGGMGQELIKRSKAPITPLWSSEVMLGQPELVEGLHKDYIDAGAQVITLNTYAATPGRLKRDADVTLLKPLHDSAMRAAERAVSQASNKNTRIAACLPPLMASYVADAAPEYQECLEQYAQIVDLQNPIADLFICETMSNIKEAKAAVTVAKQTGKEIWVSFVLGDNKQALRSGESLRSAIDEMQKLNVDAILVNCGSPETIDGAMPELIKNVKYTGAYANIFTSVEKLEVGGTVEHLQERQDMCAQRYNSYGLKWAEAGARILGGCCGIGPEHIQGLHDALIEAGHEITHKI